ncbi:MAG: anti-sigma factor [Actinomycetota bacterium]
MSGCPHGPLVGGYVLGALEPGEVEEMRQHVADCPQCGPEARGLTALPGLLDQIEPADVPPPALPPQVEEAVLDRFAQERRRERPEGESGRPREGGRAARLREGGRAGWLRRPPRASGGVVALAGACLAALGLALALAWPFGGDGGGGGAAYASASLGGLGPAAGAGATAHLAEVPAGTHVRLHARGLAANRRAMYELWCIRSDGRWVSGGTFRADPDGRTEAELTAAVRPGDYHLMVVTRRPEDARGGERGTAVLRGPLSY